MKLTLKERSHKGLLITFCGLDGCGKTTIINLLDQYLRSCGRETVLTKQPTDEMRGAPIFYNFMNSPDHKAFDYRALSLAAAGDRIQHTNRFILPCLEEQKIVIGDRYFYSCVANLRARGYASDTWIYEIGSHILKPDFSFFLDVDVETALERVRKRPEEKGRYVDIELQYELRKQYLTLADEIGGIVIDSGGKVTDCFNAVLEHLLIG